MNLPDCFHTLSFLSRILVFTLCALSLQGCEKTHAAPLASASSEPIITLEEDGTQQETFYVCPMHPQVLSEEPGSCPICGMDLVVMKAEAAMTNSHVHAAPLDSASSEPINTHEDDGMLQEAVYVCPMHQHVLSAEPGSCPICGMDLVVKKAEAAMTNRHSHTTEEVMPVVTVSDAVINQLGVRTGEVRRDKLIRHIEGFGVFLRSTVQGYRPVYHGDASSVNDTGTSTSAMLVQGQVFERQAPLLKMGQKVWVRVPGLGSKAWEGKLIGLEAQVNQTTHTQVFHVSVSPEAASVPPGMNANLIVEAEALSDVLLVPREAVIVTGHGARVMVALGGGRFEQREVDAEDFGEDQIVIRAGLEEGEQVVISAQFLLDSEANLQAGLKRLTGKPVGVKPADGEAGQ